MKLQHHLRILFLTILLSLNMNIHADLADIPGGMEARKELDEEAANLQKEQYSKTEAGQREIQGNAMMKTIHSRDPQYQETVKNIKKFNEQQAEREGAERNESSAEVNSAGDSDNDKSNVEGDDESNVEGDDESKVEGDDESNVENDDNNNGG